MHNDLGLIEYFLKSFEKYAVSNLTTTTKVLLNNLEQLDKVLPYLDVYFQHYLKKFTVDVASCQRNPTKLIEAWSKKLERCNDQIYLREVGNYIFEFIKLMDEEELAPNVVCILKELKEKCSPGDVKSLKKIEEICGKLKQKVLERLLSEDLLTESILNYYFHIVKLLNIVDREMVHYNSIVNPIKRYLVKRADVLKAIIGFWKESLIDPLKVEEQFRVIDAHAADNHQGLESDDDEEEADRWDVQNVGFKESKTSNLF